MSLTERRTVYGRAGTVTPFWMWVFQRVSGLLLGPLVVVHILVPAAPFVTWVSSLLLAIILGHAFVGLWRLAAMRRISTVTARCAALVSVLFVGVVGVFGIALLLSI